MPPLLSPPLPTSHPLQDSPPPSPGGDTVLSDPIPFPVAEPEATLQPEPGPQPAPERELGPPAARCRTCPSRGLSRCTGTPA